MRVFLLLLVLTASLMSSPLEIIARSSAASAPDYPELDGKDNVIRPLPRPRAPGRKTRSSRSKPNIIRAKPKPHRARKIQVPRAKPGKVRTRLVKPRLAKPRLVKPRRKKTRLVNSRLIRDVRHPGVFRTAAALREYRKLKVRIIYGTLRERFVHKRPVVQKAAPPVVADIEHANDNPVVNPTPPARHRFQRYTGFKNQYRGQRYPGFGHDYYGPRYLEGSY